MGTLLTRGLAWPVLTLLCMATVVAVGGKTPYARTAALVRAAGGGERHSSHPRVTRPSADLVGLGDPGLVDAAAPQRPACAPVSGKTTLDRACQHALVLYDSYGDGWNGGSIDVLVNGDLVIDDATLANGFGPGVYFFSADTGDTIDTVYTAGAGSNANYYYVYDARQGVILADGLGSSTPTGGTTTGICCSDAPANDDCTSVTPVTLTAGVPEVFAGDNTCASNDCPVMNHAQVWHAFTLPVAMDVAVDYCNTDAAWQNFYLTLADDCPCGGLIYYDQVNFSSCANGNLTLTFLNLPPGTYYLPVMRSPWFNAQGPYEVVVTGTELSCEADFSVVASVAAPQSWSNTTCGADDDCDVFGSDSEDHVYEVTIPEDGTWSFSLCDSTYDTMLALGITCCGDDIGYNDNSGQCPGSQSYLKAALTAGIYYVTVDGAFGTCGDYTLEIAWVPPCEVECPPGATPEIELCGENSNGGCSMALPAFEPIACGETVCGTVWADAGTRDTDWYEVVVTEDVQLTLTGQAEFPLVIGLIESSMCGSGDCGDVTGFVEPFVIGDECDELELTTVCLPAGTYWLFVSNKGYYDAPCGDDNTYWMTLTCTPCTAPRGACCYGDGTCAVVAECQCTGVYAGDGTTCDPNPCPPNDACADAEPIDEVTNLPIETTLALPDAAGACMTGPNIWYCYTPTETGVLTVSLCGSLFDTRLAVYEGCACDPLGPELACNDDACGGQSEVAVQVYPGASYLIEVGGDEAVSGEGLLSVSFVPAAGDLVLEAADCQDDAYPAEPGYQVVAELSMKNLNHNATGFQAFLAFDEAALSYRGDLSSYTVAPFGMHVVPIADALADAGELDLDGSVVSADLDGTAADSLLATLVFDVVADCDATTLDYRTFQIFESELSYRGYVVGTNVVPATFQSDDTAPTIDDLVVTGGDADDECAQVVTFSATVADNCCVDAAAVTVAVTETTGTATLGTPAVTRTQLDPNTVSLSGSVSVFDLTGCLATVQVDVDATDCCGNVGQAQATGDVVDGTPPPLACDDITVPADAGGACTAAVTLPATVADNCAGPVPVSYEADFGDGYEAISNPYTFDVGMWPVRGTAEDDCGNGATCEFTVTVEPVQAALVAALQLQGVDASAAPVTRCIKFIARDSASGTCAAPVHVEMTFHGPAPATATEIVEVACGAWDELCAKDEQHTLYDTQPLAVVGTQYETTAPLLLLAGDTDNDSDVDINDVTWLMYQWNLGAAAAPPAGCPWDGTRDADFDGNGYLQALDYLLLSSNWQAWAACDCSRAPAAAPPVRAEADTAALPPQVIRRVDANRDGVIDHRDVRAFEQAHGLPHTLSAALQPAQAKPHEKPAARPQPARRHQEDPAARR